MADIPINPVTRRVEFTGNTGTGPFAFTFNVLAQADVAAYKNNTLLALTSDYTVSLNSNGTGSITLTSALIATDELVIIGDLALSRTTDFVTAGDLLASSLNEQFDSNVVMSQQLDERFDRTIRSQPGDINKNLYLPLVSSRASQLLSFDSSGNITTTSLSNVPDIGTVNLTVSGVASFADGSASAPSITNIGDTNTGMYFGAADQINFSIGGSEVISISSTGTTISGLSISSGDILLTDNSATALEIKEGSNNYLTFITTNGSEKISFGSTANPTFEVNGSFNQPLIAATTSFFSQTYSGATLSATNGAVNIESYSASKAGIVLNGSGDQITFTSPTLGFVGLVQVVGAITTNTSLNIASSTTVDGILDEDDMSSNSETKLATQQSIKAYVDAQVGTVDTLAEVLGNGNTTGGTDIVVSANDVISLDAGTNALPSLTTTGDLNTGLYFPAADEVGITTGGTQRVKVDSTGIDVTGTVTADGLTVDGPITTDSLTVETASGATITVKDTGRGGLQLTQTGGGSGIINVADANEALILQTNSTNRMNIASNGDISFYDSLGSSQSFFWDASAESLELTSSIAGAGGWNEALTLSGAYPALAFNETGTSKHSRIGNDGDGSLSFFVNGTSNAVGTNAAVIDTSGNLLVGKTASSYNTVGCELLGNGIYEGLAQFTTNNIQSLTLNRQTTDGDIAQFRKDGASVGSIGTAGGDIYVGTGDTNLFFDDGNDAIWPATTNGATRDAAIDLGFSSIRYKDLYLSGGVFLGGVGSANKLDDYEEGDYEATLTCTSGTITLASAINRMAYTKIGRQVTITGRINIASVSSPSGGVVMNLPFASTGSLTDQADYALFNVVMHDINIPSDAVQLFGEVGSGGITVALLYVVSNSAWPSFNANNFDGSGNEYIYINGTYLTD